MLKKRYLIQIVDAQGGTFYLNKNNKTYFWHNHGNDKVYKTLGAAIKRAEKVGGSIRRNHTVNVVEVKFVPTSEGLETVTCVVGNF